MKINCSLLTLICFFCANVWKAAAFSSPNPNIPNNYVGPLPPVPPSEPAQVTPALGSGPPDAPLSLPPVGDTGTMFPDDLPLIRIEGGNTLQTFKLPPESERCEYFVKTDGRPMKATIQLWVGPIRQTHEMIIDSMDGNKSLYRATLKFKKGDPTLKIMASSNPEFPLWAGVRAATPERCEELATITEGIWKNTKKTVVQGGDIYGGKGAVRTFPIPTDVESVQLLFWSIDTGKKSLRAKIEVLQGPNNIKQEYDLQCGGGSQPYHSVIETPGPGWMVRVYNKKFLEDGLFEVAVVPYKMIGGFKPEKLTSITASESPAISRVFSPPASIGGKRWWE